MPYKSEKIRIDHTMYDRRRKLTDADKEEIKRIYATGVCGQRPLAKQFGVSKRTIQLLVRPQSLERVLQYRKDTWKKYQTYGEEHSKVIREHRQYKQKLYIEGKIKEGE